MVYNQISFHKSFNCHVLITSYSLEGEDILGAILHWQAVRKLASVWVRAKLHLCYPVCALLLTTLPFSWGDTQHRFWLPR